MFHRRIALALALLLAALSSSPVRATDQTPDVLLIEDGELPLVGYPLAGFFRARPERKPESSAISSALRRGYKARWEVNDDRLWLVNLEVMRFAPNPSRDPERPDATSAGDFTFADVTREVFPGEDRVPAGWFTGYLIAATGARVENVPPMPAPTHESYLIMTVEEGRVVAERRLGEAEFRVFRRAQFRSFQETGQFGEMLAREVTNAGSGEAVVARLFGELMDLYLPLPLPEPAPDWVDRMIRSQGVWAGQGITSRAGNCAMSNPKRDEAFDLRVNELGDLAGWRSPRGSKEQTPVLTGVVSPDGSIAARATTKAVCANRQRQIVTEYSGSVRETKKGLELKLQGREAVCPDMGCEFKVRYRLKEPEPPTGPGAAVGQPAAEPRDRDSPSGPGIAFV